MFETLNSAKNILGGAFGGLSSLKAPVVKGVRKAGKSLDTASDKLAEQFDLLMSLLASKPETPMTPTRKMFNFAIDLVPCGPSVRTFADARELYKTGEPEQIEAARRLCVKSALELATDTAFLGLLRFRKIRVIAAAVRYGREAKKSLSSEPSSDVFDHAAAKLIQNPRIAAAADRALRAAGENRQPDR